MPARSRPVRYAVAGTIAAAGLQLLVGALLWMHRFEFILARAQRRPDLTPNAVRDQAEGIVYGGLGVHLVLFVGYLALAWGISHGRRGARVRLTALLIVSIVAGTIATALIGAEIPVIRGGMIVVQALSTTLRFGVLYLLWIPAAMREHFSPAPAR